MFAACTTGMGAVGSIFWGEFGPWQNKLNFFSTVAVIFLLSSTLGETLQNHIGVVHGVCLTALLTFLAEVIVGDNAYGKGVAIFVSVFIVMKRRGLNAIGRKVGCLTILLAILTFSKGEHIYIS